MPKRDPVMISYYVDPAEWTPNPEQLDHVEDLLRLRRWDASHRVLGHELMMLLYSLGWRPPAKE